MQEPALESFIEACGGAEDPASPQRTRVYRRVLDAIRAGRLAPGLRLPSARRLAQRWQVARGAVDDAFAQLQAEGLIERRVGNGSFVAQRLPRGALDAAPVAAAPQHPSTTRVLDRLASLAQTANAIRPAGAERLRLRPGVPDTTSFPLAAWRREVARALDDGERSALSYGLPAGLPALRAAIARHLSLTRFIDCRAEQVLIVGSALQAVELAAQVLLEAGARVCVDDPGVVGVARALDLAQLRVLGVPLDGEGFDVDFARRHAPDAAAVVLQPLNQWPTGVRTSPARQRALLDWAQASGVWLIEHDTQGEIVHDGAAPPALMRADRGGRVLYVASFETLMFPSLRLACLVLPENLIDVFAAVRGLMGDHNPVALQEALAGFIDDGHLATHLRALRRLYRERRDALRDALARRLPSLRCGPLAGATHACLHLHDAWPDTRVQPALRKRGVGVLALSGQAWQARACNGLVLGYGADEAADIDAAVAEIALALAP